MAYISLQQVCAGFGGPLLLDHVDLQIEKGERVGLLGRNGMGKSTLFKLINGDLEPEEGAVARQQNLKTAYLPQEVPSNLRGPVEEIVRSGLAGVHGHWSEQNLVEQIVSRTAIDSTRRFEDLSAGMKRRVLLARGLVCEPDLLLLDEPTNHLDIESIDWLEKYLLRWNGTLLFVTHDRAFLQRMTTRIVELDRGRLFDWNCDYTTFARRKDEMLQAEQAQNVVFDKKLAQEEAWIRRGIEARRTRNEGRVRALKRLRDLRAERRDQPGKVQIQIQEERRTGTLVFDIDNLNYTYGDLPIVRNFTTSIQRGDRVGIIGPNGSGKTTLLKLIIGELQPQAGAVEPGTNVEIAYFDQLRSQLDESKSLLENVGQGRDVITINGKDRNLVGYLESFLFTRDRVHAPISALSGGERNRLLLARLFARPANVLVMDEPTNDLDIDTLEILEDMLLEYSGTLLLVSHDRVFLNNLVTTTLVMEGDGRVGEYVGGYDDFIQQRKPVEDIKPRKTEAAPAASQPEGPKRLSYKEKQALEAMKKELENLPARIEQLEADQESLTRAMADPSYYQRPEAEISRDAARLHELQEEITAAYARWEELSAMEW
jgi:ABC transport system ATP-binding/permease protein